MKVFSTKRACPTCGTSYPELDPRMFSLQQQARLVHDLRRHRPGSDARAAQGLRRLEARRRRKGREQSFPAEEAEVEGLVDAPCPDCHGTRLNPKSRQVSFDGRAISEVAQPVGGRGARLGRGLTREGSVGARNRHRPRRHQRDRRAAAVPGTGGPGLPDAGPRRAHASAAARRSASAWRRSWAATCRACATCSTSRPSACTRATTASC